MIRTFRQTAAAILLTLLPSCTSGAAPAPAPAASRPNVPFTISPETTGATEPLFPNGTVDYTTALNNRYSARVTPEENGFVAWLKVVGTATLPEKAAVLKMCGAPETPPGAEVWQPFEYYLKQTRKMDDAAAEAAEGQLQSAGTAPWSAETMPLVADYLKSRERQLAQMPEVVAKQKWWVPLALPAGKMSPIFAKLPALPSLAEVGKALCARAMLRMQAGDFNGLLVDVKTARLLARKVAQDSGLLERLVGCRIEQVATGIAGAAAGSGNLTVEQCASLADAMREVGPMPDIVEAIDLSERWCLLSSEGLVSIGDLEEFQATEDPAFSEFSARVGAKMAAIDRDAVDWNIVMRETNALVDRCVAIMRMPNFSDMFAPHAEFYGQLDEWVAQSDANSLRQGPNETRDDYSLRIAHSMTGMLWPEMFKAVILARRNEMCAQFLDVLIVAAKVKARTGKWPATLDRLVPQELKALPQDIYTGHPPMYLVTPLGAEIFSEGPIHKDGSNGANGQVALSVGVITRVATDGAAIGSAASKP